MEQSDVESDGDESHGTLVFFFLFLWRGGSLSWVLFLVTVCLSCLGAACLFSVLAGPA